MTREEAKLILQAWRPGGQDEGDPYFAEALKLARQDPELIAWFAGQKAFDLQVSQSLRQMPVPPQLQAQILARSAPQKARQREPLFSWRNWFSVRSPLAWAVAIMILLAAKLAFFGPSPKAHPDFADYAAQMVTTAMSHKHHVDRDVGSLQEAFAFMAANHGEVSWNLPRLFADGDGLTGCRVLAWHGHNVSMLCFRPRSGGHVDVFVTDAAMFTGLPPSDQPRFGMTGGSPTATWTHDGQVYLAISHGDAAILRMLWTQPVVSGRNVRDTANTKSG